MLGRKRENDNCTKSRKQKIRAGSTRLSARMRYGCCRHEWTANHPRIQNFKGNSWAIDDNSCEKRKDSFSKTVISQNSKNVTLKVISFQNVWQIQLKALLLQHENPPSLFTMLKSAGRFFLMARYSKTYTSPRQLVALLQSRGLFIENAIRTENYLRHIGYYRFSAYLYPLLTTPKVSHVFMMPTPLQRRNSS